MHFFLSLLALAQLAKSRPAEADPCTNPDSEKIITSVVSTPLRITGQVNTPTTVSVCDDISLTLDNVPTDIDTLVYCESTIIKTINSNGGSTVTRAIEPSAPPFNGRPGGDSVTSTEVLSSLSTTRTITNSNGQVIVQIPPATDIQLTSVPTTNNRLQSTVTISRVDSTATGVQTLTSQPGPEGGPATIIIIGPPRTTSPTTRRLGIVTETQTVTQVSARTTVTRTAGSPDDGTTNTIETRGGFVTATSTIESLTAPTTFTQPPEQTGDQTTIVVGIPPSSNVGFVTTTSTFSTLTGRTTLTNPPANSGEATTIVIGVPPTNVNNVVTRTTTNPDLSETLTRTEDPSQSGDPTTVVIEGPPTNAGGSGFTTVTQTATDPAITTRVTSTGTPQAGDQTTVVIQVPSTNGQAVVTSTQTAVDGSITGPATFTLNPSNPNDPTTVIVQVPPTNGQNVITVTSTVSDGSVSTPVTSTGTPSNPGDQTTVVVQVPATSSATGITTVTETATDPAITTPSTITREPSNPGDQTTVVVQVPATSSATGVTTVTETVTDTAITTPTTVTGVPSNPGDQTTVVIRLPATSVATGVTTISETATDPAITTPSTITRQPSNPSDQTTVVVQLPATSATPGVTTISETVTDPAITTPSTITRVPSNTGDQTTVVVQVPAATGITTVTETVTDPAITTPSTITGVPSNPGDQTTVVIRLPATSAATGVTTISETATDPAITTPSTITRIPSVPGDQTTVVVQLPAPSVATGVTTISETATDPAITGPSTITREPSNPGDQTTVVVQLPATSAATGVTTITEVATDPAITAPITITGVPSNTGDQTTVVIQVPSTRGQNVVTLTQTGTDPAITGPLTSTIFPSNPSDPTTIIVEVPQTNGGSTTPSATSLTSLQTITQTTSVASDSSIPQTTASQGTITDCFDTITQTQTDLSQPTTFTHTPANILEVGICLTVVVRLPLIDLSPRTSTDGTSSQTQSPLLPETATVSSSTLSSTSPVATAASPFSCDDGIYAIQADALVRVDINSHDTHTISSDISVSAGVTVQSYHATNYNVKDNYLYAVNLVGGIDAYIVRIDSAGNATRISKIPYAPWNLGAIDSAGQYFLSLNGAAWAQVDLSSPYSATYGHIIDSGNTGAFIDGYFAPAAWVYLPGTGDCLWSVSQGSENATLLRFNLIDKTWADLTDYGVIDGNNVFGGLYASGEQGLLYASENESGNVWELNVLDLTIKPVLKASGWVGSLLAGGARCANAAAFISLSANVHLGL